MSKKSKSSSKDDTKKVSASSMQVSEEPKDFHVSRRNLGKSEFKVGPNLELMAIERKKISIKISPRLHLKNIEEERIKAFTEYFSKSPENVEYNYQK